MSDQPRKTPTTSNRLSLEGSPYLLQHAHNPVDWYPWGEEAFERARTEGKPIFLSIGYSTCHWCHVMERESFESDAVAHVLNELFVSIKVDREERPDVDRIYMTAVQAMTGQGGWPLSAWLTPDLEPFYAGTYFPPTTRGGMPGFGDLLLQIAEAWRSRRDGVLESSQRITEAIRAASRPPEQTATESVDADALCRLARHQFARQFDDRLGGFGGAPKFPRPSALSFLLRSGARAGDDAAVEMSTFTLKTMWSGGMNDHLGGGFHRYSVDEFWRVPHFEKMLYDQAQLVISALDAERITGEPFYGTLADQVLSYVERDLRHPDGGFYSAEDADSALDAEHPNDKREGAFYLWELEELDRLLEAPERDAIVARYGVEPEGNTIQDPHGDFGTGNVLYDAVAPEEVAGSIGVSSEELGRILESARRKLFEARSSRPRPHLDDKILVAWNGLMISAFARGGRLLERPQWVQTAQSAVTFVLDNCRLDGRLSRRWREGTAAFDGQLDDHATLAQGLLDLYNATLEPRWLAECIALAQSAIDAFWSEEDHVFYESPAGDPYLLARTRELYDGAEPTGAATLALLLARLGHIFDEADFLRIAQSAAASASQQLSQQPHAAPHFVSAIDALAHPGPVVALTGCGRDEVSDWIRAASSGFHPDLVVLRLCEDTRRLLHETSTFYAELGSTDSAATAYLCRGHVCELPTTDPSELADRLRTS